LNQSSPYKDIKDIPLHCFSNKECTYTPSPELRQYLRYMLDNHPNDLEYLWRYCQQYTNYGGCYVMTFDHWKTKLSKDLTKQEK
jgi:hypothetical protein